MHLKTNLSALATSSENPLSSTVVVGSSSRLHILTGSNVPQICRPTSRPLSPPLPPSLFHPLLCGRDGGGGGQSQAGSRAAVGRSVLRRTAMRKGKEAKRNNGRTVILLPLPPSTATTWQFAVLHFSTRADGVSSCKTHTLASICLATLSETADRRCFLPLPSLLDEFP